MSTYFPTMSQIQSCDLDNLIWVLLRGGGTLFFFPWVERGQETDFDLFAGFCL